MDRSTVSTYDGGARARRYVNMIVWFIEDTKKQKKRGRLPERASTASKASKASTPSLPSHALLIILELPGPFYHWKYQGNQPAILAGSMAAQT